MEGDTSPETDARRDAEGRVTKAQGATTKDLTDLVLPCTSLVPDELSARGGTKSPSWISRANAISLVKTIFTGNLDVYMCSDFDVLTSAFDARVAKCSVKLKEDNDYDPRLSRLTR